MKLAQLIAQYVAFRKNLGVNFENGFPSRICG